MGAIANPKISSFSRPAHKVPPLGHDRGGTLINPFDMFNNVSVRTHAKFGTKTFEICFVIEL